MRQANLFDPPLSPVFITARSAIDAALSILPTLGEFEQR